MALDLPRADDLRVLRAICCFLADENKNRSSVSQISEWITLTASRLFDRQWKKTRVYHYLSAAADLGLIAKFDLHDYELTADGFHLASGHKDRFCASALSDADITVFRRVFFYSPAVLRYLAFFMPSGQAPSDHEELQEKGRPIRLVRSGSDSFVLVTAAQEPVVLTRVQKRSYAWTLFNWFRDVHLLDDVYEEDPASFLIRGREVRVFYPLRSTGVEQKQLQRLLVSYVDSPQKRVAWLYIPELLVKLCAEHGIPKAEFLNGLIELYEKDPVNFHLEMTSSVRTDDRCSSHYRYSNYPMVYGVPRSHVRISQRIASEAK